MKHYIDRDKVVDEIKRRKDLASDSTISDNDLMIGERNAYFNILSFINTLEVIDPYEQCIQYPSIEDGIKAHAEVYSFNIESELFNQLTEEQQALWRKEIEQACISGGDAGYTLAKDPRYKENLEVKEENLEEDVDRILEEYDWNYDKIDFYDFAKHFFELGLKVKGV